MAQVDFSNAHIQPYANNPIYRENDVSLSGTYFYDSSGTFVSQPTKTVTKNDSNKLTYNYVGTFQTSGTEFYLLGRNFGNKEYRVYNISFASGDTYNFSITANIV